MIQKIRLAWLVLLALNACGRPGGKMSVSFPDGETIAFEAELSKDAKFALNGQVLIPQYGDLSFVPGDQTRGFRMLGRIHVGAFLPDGWEFNEVSRLPTGAFFPAFIESPLVEVPVGEDLRAYFGVRGQKIVGLAWSFIRTTDVPVGIGADYYDPQGNRVLSALFFPPQVEGGQLTVPGGLFLATNLSVFSRKTGSFDLRELAASPYVIEAGQIRAFERKDQKQLDRYLEELSEAGALPSPVPGGRF